MVKFFKGNNKNIFTAIILVILGLSILPGCSKNEKAAAKSPAVSEIIAQVKQGIDISDMKEGDSKKLKKLYGIDSSEVQEFSLYTAPSNLKADEFAIIKVKDSKNVDKIKDKISKRIEKQSQSFKDYLPDEYFLIEKNVLKTKDNYILFVVSKDAQKIEGVFDAFFK